MKVDLRRALRRDWLPVAGVLCAACGPDAVVWADRDAPSYPLPAPSADLGATSPEAHADSLLRVAVATQVACVTPATGSLVCRTAPAAAPSVATLPADAVGSACPASLRLAAARGVERVAVWWSTRPDRTARLLAARSRDGGATWSAPLAVDTLDRGASGCERPAPSVAIDSANGFVHVAYSMRAPEGEGVFYAHQMDPRAPFEPPQVVVYGGRPSAVAVASDGDLVTVAFEDPNNGGRPFVSLAVSRTAGHTIDHRIAVSGRSVASVRPAVAVRGRQVAVGWIERPSPRTLAATDDPAQAAGAEAGFIVVRTGMVR